MVYTEEKVPGVKYEEENPFEIIETVENLLKEVGVNSESLTAISQLLENDFQIDHVFVVIFNRFLNGIEIIGCDSEIAYNVDALDFFSHEKADINVIFNEDRVFLRTKLTNYDSFDILLSVFLNASGYGVFPIMMNNAVNGMLFLVDKSQQSFYISQHTFSAIKQVANRIGNILEKERFFRDVSILEKTTQIVLKRGDLSVILDSLMELILQAMNVELGSIMLKTDDCKNLRIVAARGIKKEIMDTTLVEMGAGISGSVAKTGEPLLVTDIEKDIRFYRKNKEKYNTSSFICVPLRVKEEIIGVMNINNKTSRTVFNQDNLKFATVLSGSVANAIEASRLTASLIEQQKELDEQVEAMTKAYEEIYILHDISKTINSIMNIDDLVEQIHNMMESAFYKLEDGFISLVDRNSGKLELKSVFGDKRTYFERFFPVRKESIVSWVLESGHTLMGTDREILEKKVFENDFENLAKDFLCVPLAINLRDKKLGIIMLFTNDEEGFNEKDRNLLTLVARQVSSILSNANLYQDTIESEKLARDLQLAKNIQQELLPKAFPQIPGMDIYGFNIPAKEVGGDYFDIFPLKLSDEEGESDQLGMVIADVAGKGIPASLIMATTRSILRAEGRDHPSPKAVLTNVNDLMLKDNNSGIYVTMFYGILNPSKYTFKFAKAGHNPPLWFKSPDEVEDLNAIGLFLGTFAMGLYDEQEIQLEDNHKLVLFTDGVVEAMDRQENEYGMERLKKVIRDNYHLDSMSLSYKIWDEVSIFAEGMEQHDDFTVFILGINQKEEYNMRIKSVPWIIQKYILIILERVKNKCAYEKFINQLQLILDEALTNAYEHANKTDSDKYIFVKLLIQEEEIELSVKGEGKGFNVDQKFEAANSKEGLMKDSGRGLKIISEYVESMEFQDNGNCMTIKKKYFFGEE